MTILRESTNLKHREVEQTKFVQYLLSGNIVEKDYVSFLFEFRTIYEVIERLNYKYEYLKGLEGIERAQAIHDDLFELNDGYFRPLLSSTIKYLDRLNELSEDESKRHLLFAHVYVPTAEVFVEFVELGVIVKFKDPVTLAAAQPLDAAMV